MTAKTAAQTREPEITVAIPTRNAGAMLARVLQAVFSQKTARPFEVIALDSGSTDETLPILKEHPVRIIPIEQRGFNWGRLRERLFHEARAPLVVNLSQDAVPVSAAWLDNLVKPLEDPIIGASCGSSIPDPDRAFAQFQWEKNGYYYFTREIHKFVRRYGKGLSFANTAVPRHVWESLHIEEQATGEDFQFQIKLHEAGLRVAFPADAPVFHHHNYSLAGVFRRCRNEGLALRQMGCTYNECDLLYDLLSPAKYLQWLREMNRGALHNAGEWLYPVLRPAAVYWGSRFARKMVWY